jgi:hypothetical protein
MRIDVQVLDAEDRPVRDKRVYVSFTRFDLGEWGSGFVPPSSRNSTFSQR